jgi:fibronectin type 3 domain-containing protein
VNDDCRNQWAVSYASSSEANAANPTWSVSQVSGIVHKGSICTDGLGCPDGTRTMGDFFDVALDAHGAPHFAYNSDVRQPGTADIFYSRQCTGTTLTGVDLGTSCGGVTPPPPSTTTVCPGGRAGFVDDAGDATEAAITGTTPAPSDPSLDLLDGSVGWDAATSSAVFRARVADLTKAPMAGDGYYRWQVNFGTDATSYQVVATVPASGAAPSYEIYDPSATGKSATVTGSIDKTTGVVEIRVSSQAYRSLVAGNPALTGTTKASVTAALGQRSTVLATLTADTAKTVCSGTLAPPVTPPAAPVLTGAAQGLTVNLSWTTPADGGAPITGYQVLRGTSASSLSPLATTSGTTYADSTGAPGQTYFYAVRATNSAGTGAASNAVSATPVTTPGASPLTATAGVGSVALSWSAPFDGGSPVTGYVVERGTTAGQRSTLTTLPAGTTSYTDSAVTAGTTYRYAVHATNAVGDGPSSSEVSATPYALPGAPTLVALAGRGQVSLSWSTPADGGRPIQGYRIYRGTSSGGEVLVQTIASGTSYIDGGLTGGTTYWYRVAAFTSAGTGAQSNEVSATPKKK